jgi:hypothetical protein
VANEIFRFGLAERVFRVPLSIPDQFGGLIEITLRNYSAARRMTSRRRLIGWRARQAVYRIANA